MKPCRQVQRTLTGPTTPQLLTPNNSCLMSGPVACTYSNLLSVMVPSCASMSREDQGPATRRWILGDGAAMHYRFACGATSDAADGKVLPSPMSPPPEVAAAGHDRCIVP